MPLPLLVRKVLFMNSAALAALVTTFIPLPSSPKILQFSMCRAAPDC